MKLVWSRRGAFGSVLTFDERRERRLSILVRLIIAFWPNEYFLNFCGCNLDCSSFSQAFPRPHAVDPCQPRRRPDKVFKIHIMQLLRLRRTKFLLYLLLFLSHPFYFGAEFIRFRPFGFLPNRFVALTDVFTSPVFSPSSKVWSNFMFSHHQPKSNLTSC